MYSLQHALTICADRCGFVFFTYISIPESSLFVLLSADLEIPGPAKAVPYTPPSADDQGGAGPKIPYRHPVS